MSRKIKLDDGSWFDFDKWQAERAFMKKKELEYWKWAADQPHLNGELSKLVGDIRTLQIEKELEDDRGRIEESD